jgi:GNAT superfamily N-acetyltransferase
MRRCFLRVPYLIQGEDPCWTPRLRSNQRKAFDCRTAFFENADMGMFVAFQGDTPVGRVAAIHNKAHNEHYGDHTGFFGFFECARDGADTAAALMEAAGTWLAERGLESVRGPVNPSMHAECGLLIQGFDSPPAVLMPHNPPFYAELLESCGLRKCKDLFAYQFHRKDVAPGSRAYERLEQLAQTAYAILPSVCVRAIDPSHLAKELLALMRAFDDARQDNWGYVPPSEAELREVVRDLRQVLDPSLVTLAEVEGRVVGVLFALPDFNQLLQGGNGRLTPVTLYRFMRRRKYITRMRIVGMSVLPEYRNTGLLAMLFLEGLARGLRGNYQTAEASWVLEDNAMSYRTIQRLLRIQPYKVYRIYEKLIAPPSS